MIKIWVLSLIMLISLSNVCSAENRPHGDIAIGKNGYSAANAKLLVSGGTSDYEIVLSAQASPSEKTAADELSNYIFQITGAKMPIVSEDAHNGQKKMLAIGFNGKLSSSLKAETFGKIGPEEIILAADGDTFLISGGEPRGVLYAVYEYLHSLGVRWYTPSETSVPKMDSVALPLATYRYNPPMNSRAQLVGNGPTEEWNARNRINTMTLWGSLDVKYGGGLGQGPDMHTFRHIVPVSVLKEHPNWMAEIEGKRGAPVGDTWGLCLSNPEVRRYLVDRTLEWARANPEKKGVWLSQNDDDGGQYCQCDECSAFYQAHGGQPSSLVVLMINELAEALEKEMPDRMAKTLAYTWSQNAPSNIEVRDNVTIMFCASGSDVKPIATDKDRASLRKAVDDWRKIAKNLEVYLYSAPWTNYWFVEPCTITAAENIQWAYGSGIKNVFSHVSGFAGSYGSESANLRGWLYARLSWDPSQNPNALIEDFVRGYYGPAAEAVLKALQIINSDLFEVDGSVKNYNSSTIVPKHVNPEKIREVNAIYEKAYNSLSDPIYKKRLSMEWIPYLWTDFWLGFNRSGEYDPLSKTWSVPLDDGEKRSAYGKLAKQFMIENRINALRENVSLNPSKLATEYFQVRWPAVRLEGQHTQAVIVPEIAGKIADFQDTRIDFKPLKPYWGFSMTEYPLAGSWRDIVNNVTIPAYSMDPADSKENGVTIAKTLHGVHVQKKVAIQGDSLNVELSAIPYSTGPVEMSSAFMLDMQDVSFGVHPTVYVEQKDGSWVARVLGTETTFWYIAGSIDITNATGRIVIAAEKRPEGILLKVDPENISSLGFEYDSFSEYPADQSNMVWIAPALSQSEVQAGRKVSLSFSLEILRDAVSLTKQVSRQANQDRSEKVTNGEDGEKLTERLAPIVRSLSINSGEKFTTSEQVTINADAVAFTSLKMRFSNNEGETWSQLEEYNATKEWILPSGDGGKSVVCQFVDEQGNTHGPTCKVILDTTPPLKGRLDVLKEGNSIKLKFAGASDETSGLSKVELWYKKGGGSQWINSGLKETGGDGSFTFSPQNGSGDYYFALVAYDEAGNQTPNPEGNGDAKINVR